MRDRPDGQTNDEMAAFFNRHLIPLYVSFSKDDKVTNSLYTTFVLSVYDQWFLITAGHCVDELQDAWRHGYSVEKARLIDCMGEGAVHKHSILFDLENAVPIQPFRDDKYDYGLIFVEDHYRSLLEKNGVVPLTEDVWEKQPDEVDFYLLIGVPAEFSDATGEVVRELSHSETTSTTMA